MIRPTRPKAIHRLAIILFGLALLGGAPATLTSQRPRKRLLISFPGEFR